MSPHLCWHSKRPRQTWTNDRSLGHWRISPASSFCGGSHFHTKFTEAPADFTMAIEPVKGPGGVTISPPTAAKKLTAMGGEAKYLPPYPLLVECKTAAIKDKLVRPRVIVINLQTAAHVFPLIGGQLSWCLGHYKTRAGGGEGPEIFAELFRMSVAEVAFAPGPIRTLIIRLTQHETGTPDERVYTFIRALDVVYRPHDTEPLWVLYARPCTEYFALWEKLRELIRNTTFPVGLAEFTPVGSAPRNLGPNAQRPASICWICKNDDHRSPTCPYRTLQDWEGPNEAFDEKDGVERASGLGEAWRLDAGVLKVCVGGLVDQWVELLRDLVLVRVVVVKREPVDGGGRVRTATVTSGENESSCEDGVGSELLRDDKRLSGDSSTLSGLAIEPSRARTRVSEKSAPEKSVSAAGVPVWRGGSTENGSSDAGGSGDSAAGCRLTDERTRLGGDTTARSSEEQLHHNDPRRASGSSLPNDEPRTESSVQERIMVDAEELQAPHRLTSRDLVHLDEDTAGVSSRPAIGLRTAVAEALQAHLNTNSGTEFPPPMSADPEASWLPPIQPYWHPDDRAQGEPPPPTQLPQIPTPDPVPRAGNGKKNTKAAIKVGALNIRGNAKTTINHGDNKWFRMSTIMNKSKLGILIVGEAHLNDERLQSIESVLRDS
ncbi:hypothetical protein B0H13DRAFT_2313337 [Mycena leptocephala]|nr:hypothetical protein B0H13DRAFT_2313337 [Mycena leptocephala]